MFILPCIRNNCKRENQIMPLYLSVWSTLEKGKGKAKKLHSREWQIAKKKNHFPYLRSSDISSGVPPHCSILTPLHFSDSARVILWRCQSWKQHTFLILKMARKHISGLQGLATEQCGYHYGKNESHN